MIPQKLVGTIYTVSVKVKLNAKSNADVEDFSTYDKLTDSYSWCQFEECTYLLMPCSRKGSHIDMTLYIRVDCDVPAIELKRLAQKILKQEFFSRVNGVSIDHIGKPVLFLKPHAFKHHDEDESEYRSERIFDFIIQ